MGPKADGLRAMREKNYEERLERSRESMRKAARDAFDHAMKKPVRGVRKPKPFIPIDDTMLVPTGSLTKKPKRKPRRHK